MVRLSTRGHILGTMVFSLSQSPSSPTHLSRNQTTRNEALYGCSGVACIAHRLVRQDHALSGTGGRSISVDTRGVGNPTIRLAASNGFFDPHAGFAIRTRYFKTALVISAERQGFMYLLNPMIQSTAMEWEAWDYGIWMFGARRYHSFAVLMQTAYTRVDDWLARIVYVTSRGEKLQHSPAF
jgi:hypothetical protein